MPCLTTRQQLQMPLRGSDSAAGALLGQCLRAGPGRRGQCWYPQRPPSCRSPPSAPERTPPYLPAGRHRRPPLRAAPAASKVAAPPEAAWSRMPAQIPVREPVSTGGAACGTDPTEDSSRKLRGCWNLCHAPDPPGGDGRRKREAGGGGSSSRERRRSGRGRVALGEGSSGASAKGSVPSAGTRSSWGLIPQLQQLYPGSRSSLAAGGHRPRVCGGGKQHC